MAVTARCPECGFPALRSFIADQVDPNGLMPLAAALNQHAAIVILARLLVRNVDAVRFILSAHRHAQGTRLRPLPLQTAPTVSAAALCKAIGEYALAHYGNRDDALDTLRFWRIERSEDVGKIVAALVEVGLLTPSDGESPEDFVGLFTLDQLFAKQ